MVEEIETNNMQFLYTLSSQHNAKAWLQNCSKSVEGGGGQGMLIPIAVDWGATVDQVHNHLELPEQYSVECAKHCTWKGRGIMVVMVTAY